MSHLTLIKKLQQASHQRQQASGSEAGFSLMELIVVVIMIAVLSAIAAPGWLAFVNRQRVAKVNDAVFTALQNAQREAKRTKRSYSVSFKTDSNQLKVAVYPEGTTPLPWKPLNENLDIKAGQVILCSNIDPTTANKSLSAATCDLSDEAKKRTITFDYQGNLAPINGEAPKINTDSGLAITAAIPQSNDLTKAIPATARCVNVKTLIGSMQMGQGQYNQSSNPQGCPVP